MQKLKKKFALLLGIFLFSSCANLPKKPQIELCAHDEVLQEAECYDSQTGSYRTIQIADTDKYIMTSPEDWALILLYVDRLERKIRRKSRKASIELKKILKIGKKLKK